MTGWIYRLAGRALSACPAAAEPIFRLAFCVRLPSWLAARLLGLALGSKPVRVAGPVTRRQRRWQREFEESMKGGAGGRDQAGR